MMMMSRCDAEEDPSHTKKRKLSLPEEMVLSCLARVARSEHASLSLVSKRHRSLLLTPELYNFRSLLCCTENLIYLCLNEDKVVALNGAGACVSYIPSESKWKKGNKETSEVNRCWHVIDSVVYCSELGGRILWCEAHEWEEWREVMGLESLRETLAASKLVNYGGRLGDLWESNKPLMLAAGLEITQLDEELPGHKLSNSGNNMLIFWDVLAPNKLEIWCAEVSLERHKETCQIRGNILWSQAIMTLDPPPPHQLHCHIFYTSPLNL